MSNGCNKGDIIILKGKKPEDVRAGDILVFQGSRPEPIIHRVVNVWNDSGKHYYATKGDRNAGQRDEEKAIGEERVIGTGWLRLPYIGYVKIVFTGLIEGLKGG